MKNEVKKFWLITLSLALFTLLLHLFTCTNYELHRDELLYMALGRHLSYGYMSTPPLMGFLTFALQHIFGYSELSIKLLPALAGSFSVIIIALMVWQLGGKNQAVLIACAAFILSPAFLRSDNQFMPVPFDQFFWLALAYLMVKLVSTQNEKLWLAVGALTGLAFLNKYSIIFFALALFIALVLSPHRTLLKSRYFMYGMLLALIIVSPNLYWQAQHHFPVITHMGELRRTQLVNENPLTFTLGQLLMNINGLFIWLAGLLGLLFLSRERKFRFIGLSYVFTMVFLMLGKGKSYYALGAYPMLFAAGGYVMEKYFTGKLTWLKYFFIGNVLIAGILIMPLSLPILPLSQMVNYCKVSSAFIGNWPTRWEDGTNHSIPQDYADQTGWKQLTYLVDSAYNSLDSAAKTNCLIYANDYGQASAILYYGKQLGLPEPVSMSDAFLFWAPDSTNKTTVIFINRTPGLIHELFDSCTDFATLHNQYFREDWLHIYICQNPKPSWQGFYINNVKELKEDFNLNK